MKQNHRKLIRELTGFDVLTDVLGTLGLRSRLFCRSELSAPWTMVFAKSDLAHFHIVERGGAWLEMPSQKSPSALAPGDLLVIARGNAYRLLDQPGGKDAEVVMLPEMNPSGQCTLLRHSRGGATSVLVCGAFSFEHVEDHPVLALLPKVIHLRAGSSQLDTWLEPMVRFLIAETAGRKPGMQTIISRLTDILFVQVLRAWLADQPSQPSWLSALNDPRIGRALALIHEQPGFTWNMKMLAGRVGLTRSPFSVRFTRVVGEPPQAYLTRIRMQHAARMIREGHGSLGQIAQAVGYESESSFMKAFKRQYLKTPGQYRREVGS